MSSESWIPVVDLVETCRPGRTIQDHYLHLGHPRQCLPDYHATDWLSHFAQFLALDKYTIQVINELKGIKTYQEEGIHTGTLCPLCNWCSRWINCARLVFHIYLHYVASVWVQVVECIFCDVDPGLILPLGSTFLYFLSNGRKILERRWYCRTFGHSPR